VPALPSFNQAEEEVKKHVEELQERVEEALTLRDKDEIDLSTWRPSGKTLKIVCISDTHG